MKRALAAVLALLLWPVCARAELPRSVLVLGDSHTVGSYGQELTRLLEAGGSRVATYAVCGASARWWLAEPHPRQPCAGYFFHPAASAESSRNGRYAEPPPGVAKLAAGSPELVVIGLGSNPDGRTIDDFVAAAKGLLTALPKGARVVWVGPPPMPSRLSYIGQVYGGFAAVGVVPLDSRRWLAPSEATADHFNGEPGRAWARRVFAELSK